MMAVVNPFEFPGHGGDLRNFADKQMARALELLEAENGQRAARANALVVAGKYEEVLSDFPEINDSAASAWVLKGLALMNRAEAEGSEKLFLEAIACNAKAADIQPNTPDAHFNWGYALGALSKLKQGDEAKRLFEEAGAKYEKARQLNPNDYETYYNLGNLLGERADIVEDEQESIALLREAIEHYRQALTIAPKAVDVLNNLAATQKSLADLLDEPEQMLRDAFGTYKAAVILTDWRDYDVAYGRAITAAALASIDRSFVNDARSAFARAIITRETTDAFIDWGALLVDLGEFASAENKYLGAERLEKGSAAYNLSRLLASRDSNEAKHWLLVARETNQVPPIDEVRDDPELAPLRELDWFKNFTR
jgi:tetratricopeptide (TPR) repeat protein